MNKLFALTLLVSTVYASYPSNFPRCKNGDNECIPKAINEVLRLAKEGNDDMNLPPFEPLKIPRVDIIQDPTSNLAIKLTLRDVNLFGISSAEIYKTNGFDENPAKSKFEVQAKVPKLTIHSKYIVDGKVLILPIQGNGNCTLSFDNVDIKIKFKLDTYEKDGETYTKILKSKLQFTTSHLFLRLENLFNGNKALGENMNLFINENWEIILQELKPGITEALTKILAGIFDNVFGKIPYRTLFIEK